MFDDLFTEESLSHPVAEQTAITQIRQFQSRDSFSDLLGASPPSPPPPRGLPSHPMLSSLPGAPPPPPPPPGGLYPCSMPSFQPGAPPPPPPQKPKRRSFKESVQVYNSFSLFTEDLQEFASYDSSALTESSSLDSRPPPPPPPPPAHIRAKGRPPPPTLVSRERSGSIPDEGNPQLYFLQWSLYCNVIY